jgi:citronellyl-CoA dehydrogenase
MIYGADHVRLMDTVSSFCEREINPYVQDWEKAGQFPAHELFSKMGALGLLGINKPAEFGGQALDYTYQLAFAEALGSSRCASINLGVGVQTDMATPALARHGSDELRREFLAPSISGEKVACLGASEPGAGSDLASVKTTARCDGDDYIINGTKMWTTNGAQADWMCLLCNTSDDNAYLNKGLLCVPLDLNGISISEPFDKLGMRSSDTVQFFFDDVRVPKRYCIGSPRRGLMYQMEAFLEERIWAAASGLKGMERAIREVIEYGRTRETFGRPLIDNQYIQFTLAELTSEIEALRSLVYRAVGLHVAEKDATNLVAMSKLKAGRLQRKVFDACLQFHGGMGFMDTSDIARAYRDSRLVSIGGGSDEVMLLMICRGLGLFGREERNA